MRWYASTIAATLPLVFAAAASTSAFVCGDANNDGVLGVEDTIVVAEGIVGAPGICTDVTVCGGPHPPTSCVAQSCVAIGDTVPLDGDVTVVVVRLIRTIEHVRNRPPLQCGEAQ